MNLDEAVSRRRSVRAFLDKPVDREQIDDILGQAVRSPSWGNTQPWEIAVAAGDAAKGLTKVFCDNLINGTPGNPDFEMPDKFAEPYMTRYKTVGREVFRVLNIGREDHEARLQHYVNNFAAFNAPVLIYLLLDRKLTTVYSVFDAGLLAAHICLLAVSRGLGTCLLAALAHYPDPVRELFGLGPEKRVVLGLALGHPAEESPVNQFRTEREELDKTVLWAE